MVTATLILYIGFSSNHQAMNTYPCADDNGTISMKEAILFATSSSEEFLGHFLSNYAQFNLSDRVDLGELEILHTNWSLDRIADLVFS